MSIEIIKKDGAKPSDSGFSAVLLSWEPHGIEMDITFDKPLQISTGQSNDQVKISITKPEYFVSASSGEMLEDVDDDAAIVFSIPTQLPKGMTVEAV